MLQGFTWFKNAGVLWQNGGLAVYFDPWGVSGDPKADVIFISHPHYDHLVPEDIHKIRKEDTVVVGPKEAAEEVKGESIALAPEDSTEVKGVKIEAVPAYNFLDDRRRFHPKSKGWLGFVVDIGGTRVYHAGDTDHAPELDDVRADVALLPIGGTFTMSPPEAAGLAKAMSPEVVIPLHYGFVSGSQRDAEVFREEAAPLRVEILEPVRPWGEGAED
ncbi:MAG: MBL fold metallo-hydrolase [Actinomycetota bacterium]